LRKKRCSTRPSFFLTTTLLWLAPWIAQACPRCVDATPYRSGLQMAIAVLLPLPFTLGYFLYRFIRNAISTEETEKN
jgi:hypothetical protein